MTLRRYHSKRADILLTSWPLGSQPDAALLCPIAAIPLVDALNICQPDGRVKLGEGVVEEAARGSEIGFQVRQIALHLEKLGVGLEVKIGRGQCEELLQGAVNCPSAARSRSGAWVETAALRVLITASSVDFSCPA